jgi:hypothetical protein
LITAASASVASPDPLMRWCERDADLGSRRLIGVNAHGAFAAERPAASVNRGQLHPRARRAELDVSLRREEPLGVDHEYDVSHDWYRATSGSLR